MPHAGVEVAAVKGAEAEGNSMQPLTSCEKASSHEILGGEARVVLTSVSDSPPPQPDDFFGSFWSGMGLTLASGGEAHRSILRTRSFVPNFQQSEPSLALSLPGGGERMPWASSMLGPERVPVTTSSLSVGFRLLICFGRASTLAWAGIGRGS